MRRITEGPPPGKTLGFGDLDSGWRNKYRPALYGSRRAALGQLPNTPPPSQRVSHFHCDKGVQSPTRRGGRVTHP